MQSCDTYSGQKTDCNNYGQGFWREDDVFSDRECDALLVLAMRPLLIHSS
jgi:hypothetical protein